VIECDVHGLVICWLSAHFNRKASRYAKHDGSMMSKIMIARSFHLYQATSMVIQIIKILICLGYLQV
jgi:hypothetical protein